LDEALSFTFPKITLLLTILTHLIYAFSLLNGAQATDNPSESHSILHLLAHGGPCMIAYSFHFFLWSCDIHFSLWGSFQAFASDVDIGFFSGRVGILKAINKIIQILGGNIFDSV
jgi:hypothetical protein